MMSAGKGLPMVVFLFFGVLEFISVLSQIYYLEGFGGGPMVSSPMFVSIIVFLLFGWL